MSELRPWDEIAEDLANYKPGTYGASTPWMRMLADIPLMHEEILRLEGDLGVALREATQARARADAAEAERDRVLSLASQLAVRVVNLAAPAADLGATEETDG